MVGKNGPNQTLKQVTEINFDSSNKTNGKIKCRKVFA
jgi:hypothetical protein